MSHRSAIRANQLAVLGLTEPELTRILPILENIRERTAGGLAKMLKSGSSSATYTMHKHRSLLLQLQTSIEQAKTILPRRTMAELTNGTTVVSKDAIAKLRAMIEEGEKKFGRAITNLRLPQAKILTNVENTVFARHATKSAKYSGDVGARITRDLAIGVVQGESIDEMAQRLLAGKYGPAAARGPTAVAEAIADQQLFKNKYEAERLVRTELVNVYNAAELEALSRVNDDDPGWKKRWDATMDKRTCSQCAKLHGVIVNINENFPGGVKHPPLHPNDRCAVVPWHESWGSGGF